MKPYGRGAPRSALAGRVLVADGAMGTMLQASDAILDDFQGHEGCNEILNVTRPDIVRPVHDAYLSAGTDCVTANTFGANLATIGEYGISDRIGERSEAGARPRPGRRDGGREHVSTLAARYDTPTPEGK